MTPRSPTRPPPDIGCVPERTPDPGPPTPGPDPGPDPLAPPSRRFSDRCTASRTRVTSPRVASDVDRCQSNVEVVLTRRHYDGTLTSWSSPRTSTGCDPTSPRRPRPAAWRR